MTHDEKFMSVINNVDRTVSIYDINNEIKCLFS